MTADEYMHAIINKYRLIDKPIRTSVLAPQISTAAFVQAGLNPYIKKWAGKYLINIMLSGSSAKGTAIIGNTDVDLFISLNSLTPGTLKEIYYSLGNYLAGKGFEVRAQNVSIGMNYKGKKVDLVPARVQLGFKNYHSLYKRKSDSWIQTNISQHIGLVRNSGRINEIIALKIWRELNGIDFPSIYLELSVIEALRYKLKNQLVKNLITVFEYLSHDFIDKVIVDPSNSNNIISDELYKRDKQIIAKKARESLKMACNEVFY